MLSKAPGDALPGLQVGLRAGLSRAGQVTYGMLTS